METYVITRLLHLGELVTRGGGEIMCRWKVHFSHSLTGITIAALGYFIVAPPLRRAWPSARRPSASLIAALTLVAFLIVHESFDLTMGGCTWPQIEDTLWDCYQHLPGIVVTWVAGRYGTTSACLAIAAWLSVYFVNIPVIQG